MDENTIALGDRLSTDPDAADFGVIDLDTETITFATAHNFRDGDQVVYHAATPIGGLANHTTYMVRVVDANSIQLVATGFSPDDMSDFTVGDIDGTIIPGETVIKDSDTTFEDGDAVTYVAPVPSTFSGSQVDVAYDTKTEDGETVPVITSDPDANNIYFLDADGFRMPHGFSNGDVVIYSVEGNTAISGLTDGLTYRVANVGGEGCSLKLKPTVTASLTFTLAGTDANITGVNVETGVDVNWTDHGFKAGDSITISGSSINDGKTYTIASISADGTTLYFNGGFEAYGTSSATADGNKVIEIARDYVAADLNFTQAAGGVNAYITGVTWSDYAFQAGDSITISGSSLNEGSSTNDGTYVIASISGDKLYVTTDFSAAGESAETMVTGNAASETHSLMRSGYGEIGGLHSGQTYYVILVKDGETIVGYQLASSYADAMAGINAIPLDTTGLDPLATHQIGPQSIDLTSVPAGTTHDFRIDISGTLPGTSENHWITGPDGVDLAEVAGPPSDTVSTASSQGSGGGVYAKSDNTSNSNANATVTAYIASGSLTVTGNIAVLAQSETNARANTTNATGGFVGIGRAHATTSQTSTTTAYIAEGANIVSGGDVTIDAWSNHITTGSATAKAGGFAADVRAYMTSQLFYDTQAYLESGAKIAAAGHVGITSDANVDAVTHSNADGRGFGGGGYAQTDMDILEGSQSLVTLNRRRCRHREHRGPAGDHQQHVCPCRRQGLRGGLRRCIERLGRYRHLRPEPGSAQRRVQPDGLPRRRPRGHLQQRRHVCLLLCQGCGRVRQARLRRQ